jgi:chromosome segregation protein
MIQFSKLRINGFKSFVERTELEIAPGLNGIVGPNGCGKSNLVEALRWVMGENSAKRMRGGEGGMEDVIFAGTETRSARNFAEVSLLLDNTTRTAPAAYNGGDEIEVTRRIERDHGSNYKINGRNVRARDVQFLFADTVTGANSPAMVSQGRVSQIINAKPLERRIILEESAGISGLYARRHEAELRLKAADTNMIRIEDILGSMEARLAGLKRQSRQATRYRNVNTQIRQLEILIAWMEWKALEERIGGTRQKFDEAESMVADKLGAVTQLTKTQTAQAQDIPGLRQAEAEVAAILQTQKIAFARIEDEVNRLEQTRMEAESQLTQANIDEEHETQSLSESTEILERLEQEQSAIAEKQNNEGDKLEEKQKARDALESKVTILEEKYTSLMQTEAESRARRQSLEQQITQNTERLQIITSRRAKAEEELKALESQDQNSDTIKEYSSEINKLEAEVHKLHEAAETSQNAYYRIQVAVNEARDALKAAENRKSEYNAEIGMLRSVLAGEKDGAFTSVLDSVAADTGFEKALSRALGDALLASLEDNAPARWIERKAIKDMPELPKGVTALLPRVKAPKELHLALSQIGIVESEAEGNRQVENLLPGQALVSASGTYWRWDGFCVTAEASDRNALHLEQKNRLKELEKAGPQIQNDAEKAQKELQKSIDTQIEIEQTQKQLQDKTKETQRSLSAKKEQLSNLREKNARFESDTLRLKDVIRVASEDIGTLEEVTQWDKDRLKAYEQEAAAEKSEGVEEVRQALAEARETYQSAISAFDMHQQEQNSRKARLHAIADERINLQNRSIRARERLKQLEDRKETLTAKLKEIKAQPKDFQSDKEKLLSKISEIEAQRSEAAERLAAVETEVAETGKALKEAESMLSSAREARASAQATLAAMQEQQGTMEMHIREQFDMGPQELPQHSAVDMDKELGELESLRGKKEKLIRERENIGPVNLQADDEAQVLEAEVTKLLHERNDLMQAIEELRGAINKINKEARERLIAAFEHVNSHFQTLFTRMFAGGKAHLALIDSDDPLGAGLEIFAQPPGKALQSLSLLSGGEQALASIALIFGMFLTNPSPICVLDEIDAPLDDANVDRVCDLLEEIAKRGETRFLVITHHRMTMARMDRLYGVTMAERGVSQLVSVDLQQSFSFLEAA